jgi:3-deoxy-manno-octulosonate cytidylyltransferase (CMP-KDO synthetase)
VSADAFRVLIPARLESSRLAAKALMEIAGRPMILHVAARALESGARTVHVATDHESIRDVCAAAGIEVVMTGPEHRSGTERLAEASDVLGLEADEVVVNVQGDEPLMPPLLIRQVAQLLAAHPDSEMASLYHPLTHTREVFDPNVVKVVCDAHGRALYFSRAPIPWDRDAFAGAPRGVHAARHFRHIGIYSYRVGFLRRYVSLSTAPEERLEALEQLRALYHGASIRMAPAQAEPGPGVDTAQDLQRVREMLQHGAAGK